MKAEKNDMKSDPSLNIENNNDETDRDLLDRNKRRKSTLLKPDVPVFVNIEQDNKKNNTNISQNSENNKNNHSLKLDDNKNGLRAEDSLVINTDNDEVEKNQAEFNKNMDKLEDNPSQDIKELVDKNNEKMKNFDKVSQRTMQTNNTNIQNNENANPDFNGDINFTQDSNQIDYSNNSNINASIYSNFDKLHNDEIMKEKEEMKIENDLLKEQIRKMREQQQNKVK